MKNNLKHARTCVYNCNYHIVFSTKYRRKVLTAAEYLEDAYRDINVYNPEGLLIRTLKDKSYFEITENVKNNNINAEIEKLNMQYQGFRVYENEKITGIFNIGGKIAFYTDNCLREIIYTPTKNYNEFEKYLRKKQEFNTS